MQEKDEIKVGATSKEDIAAEREARRKAKQAAKIKKKNENKSDIEVKNNQSTETVEKQDNKTPKKVDNNIEDSPKGNGASKAEPQKKEKPAEELKIEKRDSESKDTLMQTKSREDVIVEREMKKKAKALAKQGKAKSEEGQGEMKIGQTKSGQKETEIEGQDEVKLKEKSKAELRAERRAIQEAQRAAKEMEKQQKVTQIHEKTVEKKSESPSLESVKKKKTDLQPKRNVNRVKLFSHLQYKTPPVETNLISEFHPAIVSLGAKYAARVVNGSNARCLAFLQAMKQLISDYTTPPEKEFSRGLETQIGPAMSYLNKFRPQPVSVTNALRHIKSHLTQLPNNVSDDEARAKLCDVIDTYIREQVQVAALAISKTMQRKIANGDVILTYACSSLLCQLLVESKKEGTDFSVVVVDAGPWFEGREMLRRLVEQGIKCSYVLINALSFIMRKVTTVLIGAHALLANGCVMSRAGSSLVALMAHSCNVPVLVCCETHKFSERVQTDAFVYNELGDPDEIVGEGGSLSKWRAWPSLSPLNLLYDITPPDLVTAVVTELAILPCTSVPVVLRVKPSDVAA